MFQLPTPLQPLARFNQFILWTLVWNEEKQKWMKYPVNFRTARVCNAHDPAAWCSVEEAARMAEMYGPNYGVGFVFTDADPFFFLDIDSCLTESGWAQNAVYVLQLFPGAAVEVSVSGNGLHIIGTGKCPPHGCKSKELGTDLYTNNRFVALTGTNAVGNADTDFSTMLPQFAEKYFPLKGGSEAGGDEWTNTPVPEWNGPQDDKELIQKAMATQSGGGMFGGRASFADLWNANIEVLSRAYPDDHKNRPFDESIADAALAQHLAFWTGKNCERIRELMFKSALVRDKYNRESYLVTTILKAVSMQTTVYTAGGSADNSIADKYGAGKLRANSDKQREYAEKIRASKLATATETEARLLCAPRGPNATAKFWLDNQDKTPAELAAMITPIQTISAPLGNASTGPQLVAGFQYLNATMQVEHFKGCVYIQDMHQVFTPNGDTLNSERFNAVYGGYVFQVDETGDKTTRKAWEAFTESQIIRYPKAQGQCFRPALPTGAIVNEEGRALVNTYINIDTAKISGDATPFLNHVAKILPNPDDQRIVLSYMAACIQLKGLKFQWAPLLQGAEGNGKTLLTRCVAFGIGRRYTHFPKASDIDNKFNVWLLNKLFIGIEDIYVPDHKIEVIETLKPMITGGDGIEIQGKGENQITADICANFMLNSNHKDAIRKTLSDRRFAVFYTAHQSAEDLKRDGMTGEYFPRLYDWLKGENRYSSFGPGYGYAIVNNYLSTYPISNEFKDTLMTRAPVTSSTEEAITASMGGIEQEIIEAIDEGRQGFAGGWVSSVALEKLLSNMHALRAISHNKRKELLKNLGYDWHPALNNGRVNNPIMIDDNKKPRLFIKDGHLALNLKTSAEIAKAYTDAQNYTSAPPVTSIFNQQKG